MSVPGANHNLKHEVIYVREGKWFKRIVVLLLVAIFILTFAIFIKHSRKLNHVRDNVNDLRNQLAQGGHPYHHHNHHNQHHGDHHHHKHHKTHHRAMEIMAERVHTFSESLERIELKLAELEKKIENIPEEKASNQNWRKNQRWVDEELERAKREFRQRHRGRIHSEDNLL